MENLDGKLDRSLARILPWKAHKEALPFRITTVTFFLEPFPHALVAQHLQFRNPRADALEKRLLLG